MEIRYGNSLTADEFNAFRVAVGWGEIEPSLAAKGLENSAFTVCARDGETAVGMGRIITDYGYVVYIADVVVLPEYQNKGIGGEIMSRIMAHINESILPGEGKYVALMASSGREEFYEKFGFLKRPTEEFGCGMTQWIT